MDDGDGAAARAYHERTKHSEASLRASRHFLDWENQPVPFKLYRDLDPIPLPRERPPRDVPALQAIADAPRVPGAGPGPERVPDLTAVARVLGFSAGITKRKRHAGGEIYFRAYPNTGALYHVDLYLVCGALSGLGAGVYHFGPHDFALRRLREGDFRAHLVTACGDEPGVAGAPALLVSASTYWRNAWKYQARAWRHCFWDAGTLHANLLAVAATEALGPRVVLGFADHRVETLLGLDPQREGALTVVPLGRGGPAAPPAPPLPALKLDTEPLSRRELDYPEIRAAHAASSLESGEDAAAWRRARPPASRAPEGGELLPLEPRGEGAAPTGSLEQVILRRGSTRAFDPERTLAASELATLLEHVALPIPSDFLPDGGTLVEPFVIVHAVEGIPSGAYVHRPERRALERLREGDFRQQAGRLGLFQALPATAAANVYFMTPLDDVLERFGDRGYRAAQLEGGIRGGRAYLAAYAQGFGATGLTFLDDEVTAFFGPRAAGRTPMFLVALGRSVRGRAPRRPGN